MFNSNEMAGLAAIKADRYQRNGGGGGGFEVYAAARTMHEARGYRDMSPFQQACVEMLHRYRQTAAIAREHFAMDCFASREGFHGQDIPF